MVAVNSVAVTDSLHFLITTLVARMELDTFAQFSEQSQILLDLSVRQINLFASVLGHKLINVIVSVLESAGGGWLRESSSLVRVSAEHNIKLLLDRLTIVEIDCVLLLLFSLVQSGRELIGIRLRVFFRRIVKLAILVLLSLLGDVFFDTIIIQELIIGEWLRVISSLGSNLLASSVGGWLLVGSAHLSNCIKNILSLGKGLSGSLGSNFAALWGSAISANELEAVILNKVADISVGVVGFTVKMDPSVTFLATNPFFIII
mmetsp:Transcript_20538/g.17935  ORF Transcript_20538/g.17935 Transcript_20538/m.17935 type:complete len:261 (-) Transcript_20538:1254-2036(-)